MSQLRYHFPPIAPAPTTPLETEILVYGACPAGITAALAARRAGRSVELLINSAWIGGVTTGGLSNTDIGNKRTIGGLARRFYRQLGEHYETAEEWRFEPHAAERVFRSQLDAAGIEPRLCEHLASVEVRDGRIVSATFESGLVVRAAMFIDASYEGDLMAFAGARFVIGREDNAVHGELLNGCQVRDTHQFETAIDPYVRPGDAASGLLPGISPEALPPTGTGDTLIQAYNFRMCLTQAADRIPFPRPAGYDPARYELLARYLATGWKDIFRKFDPIRGDKVDTNNHGALSTDFVGGSHGFPAADNPTRERIFQEHVTYQQGLMWFLSHDPRVPAGIRERMRTWGLPADEFVETGGWSRQLYIREARRLVSDYVVTEHDCRGYRRAPDSVALGAYAMDSHNCRRLVAGGRVINEGDVQVHGFAPYPISYRAIVPSRREVTNLFVPVCLACSHIAYGSVRMEPVFMILGESAAIAADIALRLDVAVQDVPYDELRRALEAAGQVTVWTPVDPANRAAYEPEAPPPPRSSPIPR